jgi:methylenetetrahydrofolate reductase (NADPH)
MFFDNRMFLDWQERCRIRDITVPIFAGIMPVTSLSGLRRMADLAGGTNFPAPLLRALERAGPDPENIERVGIHWATEQCLQLMDEGVEGIHFYTLNKSNATIEIYKSLGVINSEQLRGR